MAAQLFNRIGQMGLGVALVGGVVNSALYNGKYLLISQGITIVSLLFSPKNILFTSHSLVYT